MNFQVSTTILNAGTKKPGNSLNALRIKGKAEQFRGRSRGSSYTSGVVAIEKEAFGLLSTTVAIFTYFTLYIIIIVSCCEHEFPRNFFAIRFYHPSLLGCLLDYILCPYGAVSRPTLARPCKAVLWRTSQTILYLFL